MSATVEVLAEKVRSALDSADLEQFAELLDPHVTWGAPGDGRPPCQNRQQVLAWYARGRAAGRRAHVRSVKAHRDKILVAMTVTSSDGDNAADERWQVLTIVDGLVSDIRGYDDRAPALAAAGLSTSATGD